MSTILSELAQLAVALTSLHSPTKDNMHFTNTDNPIDFPKVKTMNSQEREVMNIPRRNMITSAPPSPITLSESEI